MKPKRVAPARIVGVEEHVNLPSLTNRLPEAAMVERGYLSHGLDDPGMTQCSAISESLGH